MLSSLQKSVLIGTLLGDGNLQTNNGQTWRYRAIQKTAHTEYLNEKYEIFKEFCKSTPKDSEVFDSRTNKTTYRRTFQTVFTEEFRFYGQLFYKKENGKWKKHVPTNISKFLDPMVLAYWYMDDGALKWKGRSNAVRLCTDSFTVAEVNLLKDALTNVFGLNVSINKAKDGSRLCILESSYPTLVKLIANHLLPSMYYKFPDGNYGVFRDQDISQDIFNQLDQPRERLEFFANDNEN